MTKQEMVLCSMVTAQQACPDSPTYPGREIVELRDRLHHEEAVEEFKEAIKSKCIVQVADSIGDAMYVFFGTAVAFGINLTEQSNSLIESEVQYLNSELGITPVRTPKFVDNEVLLNASITCHEMAYISVSRAMAVDHGIVGITGILGVKAKLEKAIATFRVTAKIFGIDIDPVFNEIHRSNMSKFIGWVILDEGGKYLKGPHYFKPDIRAILLEQGAIL